MSIPVTMYDLDRRLVELERILRGVQLHRPPIERYVRCSVTRGAWTVEPGIEWCEGDSFEALSGDLEVLAAGLASLTDTHRDPISASRRGEAAFAQRWPGRAFFIEVHSTDGRWVQVFQPFGVPRNR